MSAPLGLGLTKRGSDNTRGKPYVERDLLENIAEGLDKHRNLV